MADDFAPHEDYAAHIVRKLAAAGVLRETVNGSDCYEREAHTIISAEIADVLKLVQYLTGKIKQLMDEITERGRTADDPIQTAGQAEPKEPDVVPLDDPTVPYSLVPVGEGSDSERSEVDTMTRILALAQPYPRLYRALAKACAELGAVPASPWQPIASAPKMRTILLFAVTDLGENGTVRNYKMETGYWHIGHENSTDGYSPWRWDGHQIKAYEVQPTHWMALPQPPLPDPPAPHRSEKDDDEKSKSVSR